MLGLVFIFSQFSAIEITVLTKKFFYPVEDIDSVKSNVKRYFTSDQFLQSSGSLKTANLAMLWSNLCAIRSLYS